MHGELAIKGITNKQNEVKADSMDEVKVEAAPDAATGKVINLLEAEPGKTYTVKEINTDDEEMNSFLFRLGCYAGEPITLVSKKKNSSIVVIKDGRYNLDVLLSEAIIVE